jgi:hypothetical protein
MIDAQIRAACGSDYFIAGWGEFETSGSRLRPAPGPDKGRKRWRPVDQSTPVSNDTTRKKKKGHHS